MALSHFLAFASSSAELLLPLINTACLFTAGFVIRFSAMPTFWRWFGFVNFSRFAWSALMANQFSGPLGDPVWIGGQTVLEHYELKGPSLRQTHGYVQPEARTWPFVGIMAACAPRNSARRRSFRHSPSVRADFVGFVLLAYVTLRVSTNAE